ncbi:S41 family peptidase [Deinococcus pimensis]|uniref:S41 family peptidase n=1 Tax=Deinococcus pimensis TaxID=309888 RepID=UPI0004869120|nr:S41 family peptidase [Deinococcus pimensis]
MKQGSKALLVAGALAATTAVAYAQLRSYDVSDLLKSQTGTSFLQALTLAEQIALKSEDRDKLLEGAIKGMLGTFDDPYTRYVPPTQAARDNQDQEGEFFGIGVTFTSADTTKGTGGKIEAVYKGRPADLAGVQPGDVFLKIDGDDVTNTPQDDLVGKIRGKENTNVKITFGRGKGSYEVTLKRSRIEIVSVETSVLPGNIGYVALNDFSNTKVLQQFPKAIADFKAKGIQKVIFDLRGNPGGNLCIATAVADQFLTGGDILKVRERGGKAGDIGCPGDGKAAAQATDYKGKLAVLIDGGSASASEIVAGALQDSGRATLVGAKSFGKGIVQAVYPLQNGGKANITFEEWLTPKGRSIHKQGVTPDVKVEDSRAPKIVTFEGTGAKAGEKITVNVGGRSVTATADADGKFTFTDTPKARPRTNDGNAVVDPKTDAQLARAIEVVNK